MQQDEGEDYGAHHPTWDEEDWAAPSDEMVHVSRGRTAEIRIKMGLLLTLSTDDTVISCFWGSLFLLNVGHTGTDDYKLLIVVLGSLFL